MHQKIGKEKEKQKHEKDQRIENKNAKEKTWKRSKDIQNTRDKYKREINKLTRKGKSTMKNERYRLITKMK